MMRPVLVFELSKLADGRIHRMNKRIAQALALGLLATPLLLVGCGSSDNGNGGTGGSSIVRYDAGSGGTGGSALDGATAPVDTGVVDATIAPDMAPVVDAAVVDVPLSLDAPVIIDSAKLDTAAIDVAPAIDTTPAIDLAPVACAESPKFSGGDVTANRTLSKACSPYDITDSIYVDGNAILTIEPGVTLRFETTSQSDIALHVGNNGAGQLVAKGTATDPIVFTSPTSGAGDWAGIALWGGTMTGTSIAYATVDYCGQGGRACINGEGGVKPARVTIDHVTIDHVGSGSNAIQEGDADSNFTISNCTFKNVPTTPTQQYAISVSAASFAGIDSTNTFNGNIVELAGDTVSATTTWKNPGTPVIVTSDLYLDGTPAPILNIAAGTAFRFAQNKRFAVAYGNGGNLKVNGTATSRVTFTSANAAQAAGDWGGIMVWAAGEATIQYTDISYGGAISTGTTSGDVSVDDGAKLTISNSTLSSSSGYGLWIDCASAATVTDTTITYTSNVQGTKGPGPTGPTCL
jgi:hypothetical protein